MPHCQAMGKREYIGPQVHTGDEGKGENRFYSTHWTHKSRSCDKLGLIIVGCSIYPWIDATSCLQLKNGDYLAETA